jgi:WD40 repeat protein
MVVRTLLLLATCLASLPVVAEEIVRTHHLGAAHTEPLKHERVFVGWLDENTLVYSTNGRVVCYDIEGKREKWVIPDTYPCALSVEPEAKRVAIVQRERTWWEKQNSLPDCKNWLAILDASNGKVLSQLNERQLRRQVPFSVPWDLDFTNSGVVACGLSDKFATVVGPKLSGNVRRIKIESFTTEMTVSPDGKQLTTVSNGHYVCVRDIATGEKTYSLGDPEADFPGTDTPFVSHAQFDGKQVLIHTVDGGWGNGEVHVTDITNGKAARFNARRGHIVMAVDFKRKQIALTGTSKHLTVLRFDGTEVAELKNATKARNSCVAFSPSGKRIAVGCDDRTVSVFAIR